MEKALIKFDYDGTSKCALFYSDCLRGCEIIRSIMCTPALAG